MKRGAIAIVWGKRVKIVERADGFVSGPTRYWVRALERIGKYDEGQEFTVAETTLKKNTKGASR